MALQLSPGPRAIAPLPEPALGLWGRIQKFLQPQTSPARVPEVLVGGLTGYVGMVTQNTILARPPGASTWRAYSQTPWAFAAINIRTEQVAGAEWDIVAYDNTKRFAARQRDRLKELFSQPSATLD